MDKETQSTYKKITNRVDVSEIEKKKNTDKHNGLKLVIWQGQHNWQICNNTE